MGQEECDAVVEALKSGWIGLGPKTVEFEQEFAKYVGVKHAVATNSGTAALHLALKAFDIGEGDEILVSTVHAILYNSSVPVFVDVEPDTLRISVKDIEKKITDKTKAILPVHYGGHPCDMDEIMGIGDKHNLVIIGDAAHACGAEYKGQKIGSIEDATCFSFHAVNNLTTGERERMITTNHSEIVNPIKRLRWVGTDKGTWERTELAETEIETELKKYKGYGWYGITKSMT